MRAAYGALLAMILVACAAGTGAMASEASAEVARTRQSFDLHVPHAPAAVPLGRERRLIYEVHLTSFARDVLSLSSVDVVDDRTGAVLGRLEGAALEAAMDVPGMAADATSKRNIEPGSRAIIYIDLSISGSVPATLRHRVGFETAGATEPEAAAVIGARTNVDSRPLPVLGPPLRGGPWVAVYDPRLERGHRRVIYAVGGKATIPGRHAIDWMRPSTGDGVSPQGDPTRGAGAEVLAVADGMIASTRDDVPEPTPGTKRPRIGLADATGNYISLDLGGGRYAFYEHLMPGLRVKPGDGVRRGQVIGRLGSTGQASRPHLHFHLADADSPLGAEGLPYVLSGARVIGAYPSIVAFETGKPWMPARGPEVTAALPPPNAVIQF